MKKILVMCLLIGAGACDDGSSGDPDTNDLGEFNPPNQLQSLTRSDKLILTWIGANAEDDFQGYHVFGTTTSLTDLQDLVAFPADSDVTQSQSIPRCKDNSAFFEAFGFPTTDSIECESSVAPDPDDSFFLQGRQMGFIQDESSSDDSGLTIDFNIPCTGDGQTVEDGSVSLSPAEEDRTLGRVYCDVEKVWDPDAEELVSIANGTTYTYLVVAVKGSDKNQISWVSNVIEDTPVEVVFAGSVELNGGDNAQYANFAIDAEDFADLDTPTATTCSDDECSISGTNDNATDGIYVARDNADPDATFGFSERLIVSSSSSGDFKLQFRGGELFTIGSGDDATTTAQTPGDEAAANGNYQDAGSKFASYGQSVFDFQYNAGNDSFRYGKLVITHLSYADETDETSTSTVDVTIHVQPTLDNVHYLQ